MANYRILNLEVKKIERGVNKGNEYIIGAISNTLDLWAPPTTITIFNTQQIAVLKAYIPKAKGGESDEETLTLPEEFRTLKGNMYSYIPPKEMRPFIRVYTTTDAARGWVAGEPVIDKRTGKPRLYEELRVFCRYYIDPEISDKPQFSAGESPIEKGRAMFDSFYMSLADYYEKKGITTEHNDANPIEELPDDIEEPAQSKTNPGEQVLTDSQGKQFVIRNGQIVYL